MEIVSVHDRSDSDSSSTILVFSECTPTDSEESDSPKEEDLDIDNPDTNDSDDDVVELVMNNNVCDDRTQSHSLLRPSSSSLRLPTHAQAVLPHHPAPHTDTAAWMMSSMGRLRVMNDLEVSPLVVAVPPMPGEHNNMNTGGEGGTGGAVIATSTSGTATATVAATAHHATTAAAVASIPASFRAGPAKIALKKRKSSCDDISPQDDDHSKDHHARHAFLPHPQHESSASLNPPASVPLASLAPPNPIPNPKNMQPPLALTPLSPPPPPPPLSPPQPSSPRPRPAILLSVQSSSSNDSDSVMEVSPPKPKPKSLAFPLPTMPLSLPPINDTNHHNHQTMKATNSEEKENDEEKEIEEEDVPLSVVVQTANTAQQQQPHTRHSPSPTTHATHTTTTRTHPPPDTNKTTTPAKVLISTNKNNTHNMDTMPMNVGSPQSSISSYRTVTSITSSPLVCSPPSKKKAKTNHMNANTNRTMPTNHTTIRKLVSFKDQEAARIILHEDSIVADLLDVLPKDDAFFLGRHFWIFTVAQLRAILNAPMGPTFATTTTTIPEERRVELINHMLYTLNETSTGLLQPNETANQRVLLWKRTLLEKQQREGNGKLSKTPLQERFPLDGPISVLFPQSARNFLASAKVTTLFQFLSLKKTDTGLICHHLRIWREHCNLPHLPKLDPAKFLMGIAHRVQSALSSSEPVDMRQRQRWLNDPIIGLTGAARDFVIVHLNIQSADTLMQTRTKDLAKQLSAWRAASGFAELRGSGSVAMISVWKASMRAAIEVERHSGHVLVDVNFDAADPVAVPAAGPTAPRPTAVNDENNQNTAHSSISSSSSSVDHPTSPAQTPVMESLKSPKSPKLMDQRYFASRKRLPISNENRQAQYALNAKLFLVDILGNSVVDLLEKANITTAIEFFDLSMKKASIMRKLIMQAQLASNECGCSTLLNEWYTKIMLVTDQMIPTPNSLPALASPSSSTTSTTTIAPMSTTTTPPTLKRARSENERSAVDSKKKTSPSITASNVTRTGDPFESLSAVTKRFLKTMDITSAEKFLSTRTTDIATSFIDFRIKEGMAELKGLGAIASVSGWKAVVRKTAKELGKEDIVTLEPANRAQWGAHSRLKPEPSKIVTPDAIELAKFIPYTHRDVLSGKTRAVFAVKGHTSTKEPDMQHRFELSVRRPNDSSPFAIFLSYRGAAPCSSATSEEVLQCLNGDSSIKSPLTVMKDVEYVKGGNSSLRSVFSSRIQGAGLIFLSPYGVRPVVNQDLQALKSEIKSFVLDGKSTLNTHTTVENGMKHAYNTVMRRNPTGIVEYFLLVDKPIEKGQCLEICFMKLASCLQRNSTCHSQFQLQHALDEAFGLISRSDLRQLLSYLESDELGALKLLSVGASGSPDDRVIAMCRMRRRLHWVTVKLTRTLQEWHQADSTALDIHDGKLQKLYFGSPFSRHDIYQRPAIKKTLKDQFKQELLASLEFDKVCGFRSRKHWCSLFKFTFEAIADCMVDCYIEDDNPSSADMLAKLSSCMTSCVSSPDSQRLDSLVISFAMDDADAFEYILLDDNMFASFNQDLEFLSEETKKAGGKAKFIACGVPGIIDTSTPTPTTEMNSFNADCISIELRPLNKIADENTSVSNVWYCERQWWIIMTVVVKCGILLSIEEQQKFLYRQSLLALLKKRFIELSGISLHIEDASMESFVNLQLPKEGPVAQLSTLSFFLELVWPRLKKHGWRLEAGATPSDVTYIAPNVTTVAVKREIHWKHQRDSIRSKIARETTRTGLGNLSKTAKRVFIALIPKSGTDDDGINETSESKGISTSAALQRFIEFVESQLDKDDLTSRSLLVKAIDLVKKCFNDLAIKMLQLQEDLNTSEDLSAAVLSPPCDRFSCDHLLRFSLILPSILRQSDLPLHEINDCNEVIRELADWMTTHYTDHFSFNYHPPIEMYVPGKHHYKFSPYLSQRLKTLSKVSTTILDTGTADANRLIMKELVRPEDKVGVTDFVVAVLEQAVPCRATEYDIAKKYRRITVGFPGVVCKHCLGQSGEGRYFFSSLESFATSSTVFEKHLLKCKSVPVTVKNEILETKKLHIDQRKGLPTGSQQKFFNQLWDRIRSSQISWEAGAGGAMASFRSNGNPHSVSLSAFAFGPEGIAAAASGSNGNSDFHYFRDHRTVLDFIGSHAPWKIHGGILEGVQTYDSYVDFGGRVLYTSSEPHGHTHFGPEWVLRKMGHGSHNNSSSGLGGGDVTDPMSPNTRKRLSLPG